ncbi:MAG: diaminopimelate epimerase [Bacteroidales bacterium]|nr:diaminopimelate epimerase [Bacteroidales bacterium]
MNNNRKIKFTKMHGAGNDYIYIDCFATPVDSLGDISQLAIKMSDRHFGVGSDGLVLIMPSDNGCDVRMRMLNSDGSEAEMCGNASRCVAKYAYDHKIVKNKEFKLQTKGGIKYITVYTDADDTVTSATVNMGAPILSPADIPVKASGDKVVASALEVDGDSKTMTCVSMGNPHCILFVDGVDDAPVHTLGPKVEVHTAFPRKTNVEFAHVVSRSLIEMRVWERGAGETMACGTGACATLVAAALNNLTDRKATLKLLGGNLEIEWRQSDNNVYMTGPAAYAFTGEF